MTISQDFLFILQHQKPLFLKNLAISAAKRLNISNLCKIKVNLDLFHQAMSLHCTLMEPYYPTRTLIGTICKHSSHRNSTLLKDHLGLYLTNEITLMSCMIFFKSMKVAFPGKNTLFFTNTWRLTAKNTPFLTNPWTMPPTKNTPILHGIAD